jgi:hypothetical protein
MALKGCFANDDDVDHDEIQITNKRDDNLRS